MVDADVIKEVKQVLVEMFPDAPVEMLDYAFKCRVLDVNKCRIAIIKRFYYSLISGGMTSAESKYFTAEKFCRSEKTIENIIYNEFYKGIKI
jgi:hypothetical protein